MGNIFLEGVLLRGLSLKNNCLGVGLIHIYNDCTGLQALTESPISSVSKISKMSKYRKLVCRTPVLGNFPSNLVGYIYISNFFLYFLFI